MLKVFNSNTEYPKCLRKSKEGAVASFGIIEFQRELSISSHNVIDLYVISLIVVWLWTTKVWL